MEKICQICSKKFKTYQRTAQTCRQPPCIAKAKKITFLKRYGVDNPAKSDIIKEKIKKSRNNEAVSQKMLAVWRDRPQDKKDLIKEKRKNTNVMTYGVENVFQNNEIKNKIKQKNIKNLGVQYPTQSSVVKEKIRNNWKHKPKELIKSIVESRKTTCLSTYGVDNGSRAHIPPETIELFSNKDELKKIYNNVSCSYLAKRYGVSPSYVLIKLREHDIDVKNPTTSVFENDINDFVKSLGFKTIRHKRSILSCGKEIDIYIPDKAIAIEFNGLFWHSEQNVGYKRYHVDKTDSAESVGIHLIHIFEDDWIYKKDIVQNRLTQVLGKSNTTYYARNCTVRLINNKVASFFLNQHHLQGSCSASVKIGLYRDDDLVACMTFSKLRRSLGHRNIDGFYELVRFCSIGNVVGGASKMLKHFIRQYRPKKIISYADRHWTSKIKPNLYDNLGFVKVNNGKPNYWYIVDGVRIHRFNFRKSELNKKLKIFDPNVTGYENMLRNGHDRIWGCGSLKYEMTLDTVV